jgi:hypothetical protein
MKTILIRGFKKILGKFRSGKILNKIGAGKEVYFEDPLEEIVLSYSPGGKGKPGKYSFKHFGQKESEISFESPFFLRAVLKGKPISKARYCNFNLIKGLLSNPEIKSPLMGKTMSDTRVVYG